MSLRTSAGAGRCTLQETFLMRFGDRAAGELWPHPVTGDWPSASGSEDAGGDVIEGGRRHEHWHAGNDDERETKTAFAAADQIRRAGGRMPTPGRGPGTFTVPSGRGPRADGDMARTGMARAQAADRLPNLAIPEMNGVGAQEIFV